MATVARNRPPVKPARRPAFSAELLSASVRINGIAYRVEPIPAGEFGTVAYRLTKRGVDIVYDVVRTREGLVACDCPDYEARHRGNGSGMCKHGRALVELGLVAAPKAAPAPALVPAEEPAGVSCPIDSRELPKIDGTGLEPAEWMKVNGARSRGMAIYAGDVPEAPAAEVEAVGNRAATDALRAVLRDRPAAPALPCCSPAEPAPCLACSTPSAAGAIDPGDVEGDPEDWPAWTDNWLWTTSDEDDQADDVEPEPKPAELLTLDQLIDREASRLRGHETHAGDLMARVLAELAETVRFVHAHTPADYEARVEALERLEPEPEPEMTPAGQWA